MADFFFKGFQYISTRWDGFIYFSLCSVTSLNVIGLFPGADQSDGMLVFCILFARPQQICDRCLLMLENDLLRRPTDFKSLLIHYCKMVLKQVVSKIGTFVQTDNFVR